MADDLDDGEEPDARFSLANERTFLAWNRTGLALIGGGLAAGQLLDFRSDVTRLVAALLPIALGTTVAIGSYRRWAAVQRALRHGEPLPRGPLRPLSLGIAAMGVIVAIIVIVDVAT